MKRIVIVGGRFAGVYAALALERKLRRRKDVEFGGEFILVERPSKLAYTWSVTPGVSQPELVTVRFDWKGPDLTEVVVIHERIESAAVRDSHATGWNGCLDGLRFMLRRIDSHALPRIRLSAKWPLTC